MTMKSCVVAGLVLVVVSGARPVSGQELLSPRPALNNLAAGRAVTLNTPPNYPQVIDDADAAQLTDGRLTEATPMWYDKAAVGWVGVDPCVLTIDLGEDQAIRGVGLHTSGGLSGVEWPASVQVFVSDTGESYSLVGDVMGLTAARPPASGYAALWLVAEGFKTHGRYVKLVCAPTNRGGGAYIMLDEIEVYQGEAAWLKLPLAAAEAPRHWRADWGQLRWRDRAADVPEAERPVTLTWIDGDQPRASDGPLHAAKTDETGVRFTLAGEPGRVRSMVWSATLPQPVSAANSRYALITFQAEGIRRTYDPYPLVMLRGLNAGSQANELTLLAANAAPNDSRSHTLIAPLPQGLTITEIRVALTTESSRPALRIESLQLLNEVPDRFTDAIDAQPSVPVGEFAPVALLQPLLNETYAGWLEQQISTHGAALDGAGRLRPGPIVVSGVPFQIASGEHDLAAMPCSAPADGQVSFLGEMVDKRYLLPESRDDALSVEVDAAQPVREVLLLLASHVPPIQVRGGHAGTAARLDDIEILSVELIYDEGDSDLAFPYSLADEAPVITSRLLGAYAVAADPRRRLRRVVLHNRHFGPNFALVAVTLNRGGAVVAALGDVQAPEPTHRPPEPADQPVSVVAAADRVTFANRWYECSLDLSQGFVIDRFVNRWNAATAIEMDRSSGLRVRVGDTMYTGRSFRAEVVRAAETSVELRLTSTRPDLPIDLRVTVAADDSPQLLFTVEAVNRGGDPRRIELSLPALSGLTIGDVAGTRLFFPQYTAVDSGERIALRAPYGLEFTQQYLDIYNRSAGVGLMLRTHNDAQRMADFTLSKDESGVAAGVCFPAAYNVIPPGGRRDFVPVALVAHGGDWRDALVEQRRWVGTWYRPRGTQDEDFFLKAWDIACYRTSTRVSWNDTRTPAFISPDRKRFLLDETFDFEKEHNLGHLPDIVHFFNWTHNDQTDQNEYGVFGTPLAYEQVGGLEFFRDGIDQMQRAWGMPVSLYTLIDRVRASSLPDRDLAQHIIKTSWHQQPDTDNSGSLRAAGLVDGIYYPQRGDHRWLDFTLQDIARMQQDTGCRLVYVDVFPHWSHLTSDNPVTPRDADMLVLERLRGLLPDEAVLWAEYPSTDYASQWSDGSLQYYFIDLNEVFARRYNERQGPSLYKPMPLNAGRYILPRYKTIALPGYIEAGSTPGAIHAIFVNGEAIQEDTWRLHHSRMRQSLNRASQVKRQYTDCFTTDEPAPQVDTAAAGLVANRFPGENRLLWTLYNGRPGTFDGVVLRVPHRPDARYFDAWNDRELIPTIEGGFASLSVRLDPQQPGCVVQDWSR